MRAYLNKPETGLNYPRWDWEKSRWAQDAESFPTIPIVDYCECDNLSVIKAYVENQYLSGAWLDVVQDDPCGEWFLAGNEHGYMVLIQARSFEIAYEEFLAYLESLPGYQGETPDSEEEHEWGTYTPNGTWLSEVTAGYLHVSPLPADYKVHLVFDPNN